MTRKDRTEGMVPKIKIFACVETTGSNDSIRIASPPLLF